MKIYLSAAKHLQHRPYLVTCPEYSSRISPVVEEGLIPTVHNPIDPYATVRSHRPIADMIDMMSKRIPFTIVEDRDVLLIMDELDAYLREIQTYPKTDEIAAFLKDLLPFRERIMALRKRVLRKHPDWGKHYRQMDSGYLEILYKLMEASGAVIENFTSPEEAYAYDTVKMAAGNQSQSLQDRLDAHRNQQSSDTSTTPPLGYDSGLG